jgi:hypothetical protein
VLIWGMQPQPQPQASRRVWGLGGGARGPGSSRLAPATPATLQWRDYHTGTMRAGGQKLNRLLVPQQRARSSVYEIACIMVGRGETRSILYHRPARGLPRSSGILAGRSTASRAGAEQRNRDARAQRPVPQRCSIAAAADGVVVRGAAARLTAPDGERRQPPAGSRSRGGRCCRQGGAETGRHLHSTLPRSGREQRWPLCKADDWILSAEARRWGRPPRRPSLHDA